MLAEHAESLSEPQASRLRQPRHTLVQVTPVLQNWMAVAEQLGGSWPEDPGLGVWLRGMAPCWAQESHTACQGSNQLNQSISQWHNTLPKSQNIAVLA